MAALTRYSRLAKADAVLVCVPTPLTRNRELDLRPLLDSTQALAEVLQSVSLEDALEDADLALILTAHPQVDHQLLAQRARLLLDARHHAQPASPAAQHCSAPRLAARAREASQDARRVGAMNEERSEPEAQPAVRTDVLRRAPFAENPSAIYACTISHLRNMEQPLASRKAA